MKKIILTVLVGFVALPGSIAIPVAVALASYHARTSSSDIEFSIDETHVVVTDAR